MEEIWNTHNHRTKQEDKLEDVSKTYQDTIPALTGGAG